MDTSDVSATMIISFGFHPYYKTRMCQAWIKGECHKNTSKCFYAHGENDLRTPLNIHEASCEKPEKTPFIYQTQDFPVLSKCLC